MKKIYIKNNHGFTLIEMLLVLSIIGLVTVILSHITLSISEKRNIDQFFTQVMFDIQRVQALAIEEEKTISISFNNGNRYSAYYQLGGENILTRNFPEGVKLNIYSNLKSFYFHPNGNVGQFGTIIFHTPIGNRNLIVNIQEGRLKLVEQ